MTVLCVFGLVVSSAGAVAAPNGHDPFARLDVYGGEWSIRAAHPWSGAPRGAVDRLSSNCRRFPNYYACEQIVDGKPASLIVYTPGAGATALHTRTIAPDGRASGRGDLTFAGDRWTYLDKPPPSIDGPWSRTVNVVLDRDHIRFEEYESADRGKSWRMTNSGMETRVSSAHA